MQETKTLDRREFTLVAALAALSGVTITISACGGGGASSPSSPSAPNPPTSGGGTGDKTGVITANHGHVAVVTGAQLTAGNAVSLSIQGTSDHPHTVELTAAEIGSIASNQRVSKTSSTDASHNHTVTFN